MKKVFPFLALSLFALLFIVGYQKSTSDIYELSDTNNIVDLSDIEFNIQVNNVSDCIKPGDTLGFDVTPRVFAGPAANICDNNLELVFSDYEFTYYIVDTTSTDTVDQFIIALNDIDTNTGTSSDTSLNGQPFSVVFLDNDYDTYSAAFTYVGSGRNNVPGAATLPNSLTVLSYCDDFSDNPCDISDPENPCPGASNPPDQRDLYFRVNYITPDDLSTGAYEIKGIERLVQHVFNKTTLLAVQNAAVGASSFPASYQAGIDFTVDVTEVEAGSDQSGTSDDDFTMTALAVDAGCTGAWSDPNGTGASFVSTTDPTTVVTFPDGTLGDQELVWSVNCNGCETKDTVIISLSAALPVNLVSFIVTAQEEIAKLTWKTSSEYNNEAFEIERSTDGSSFQKIGTVPGAGNSTEGNDYNFDDHQAASLAETIYYRLRQIDFNGESTFSAIQKAHFKQENLNIIMFPNPAKVGEQVTINGKDIKSIQVISIRGDMVKSYKINSPQQKVSINTSELPKGLYKVVIDGTVIRKLIVQ